MRSGEDLWTDRNGDNLQINRAYERISDYCSITVRVRIRVQLGLALRIALYKLLEKVTKCRSVT